MKIGLLVTSVGDFGQKGFYNTQEIGLAKALSPLVEQIFVYKLVPEDQKKRTEQIEGYNNASITYIPAKKIGNNGKIDVSLLDTSIEALIYFCDTQFAVPKVDRWAKKNKITLFPYIGVVESHSTNKLTKIIVNTLFFRNVKVYRRNHCFAKNHEVEEKLRVKGINKISVMPVGLDVSLLHQGVSDLSKNELKIKYGFQPKDKILLFVGRFIDEKRPMEMLELYKAVYKKDKSYRLLMIGNGELRGKVEFIIQKENLGDKIQLIDRVPNADMWEVYSISEAFVNLNKQEIFGMAILEAMYYGCKVIAWHAPGPDIIIENEKNGWLVFTQDEAIECINNNYNMSEAARQRIISNFTWDVTAKKMSSLVCNKK